jgi:hypothetical protein
MTDREATNFRKACKRVSDTLGTPSFEGAMLEFYVALAALRKEEKASAN